MDFEKTSVKILPNRGGGYFAYKVVDDDAVIIHHLLNYKLKNNIVIFTSDALTKVIDVLKMYSISFEIVGETRYTFLHNNYQVFLSRAYQALDKEYRVNRIVKKIELLDSKKLDQLLKIIEDFLHE